eukprot:m.56755 g.56755  ORF g.56755 m.56755 type:complete len:219 (+) comp9319_c0_seq2:37-693(+)
MGRLRWIAIAITLLSKSFERTVHASDASFLYISSQCTQASSVPTPFNRSQCHQVPVTSPLAFRSRFFQIDTCLIQTGYSSFTVNFFANHTCAERLFTIQVEAGVCNTYSETIDGVSIHFGARVDTSNSTWTCYETVNNGSLRTNLSAGDDVGIGVAILVFIAIAIVVVLFGYHSKKTKRLEFLHRHLSAPAEEEQQMQLMFATDEPSSPQDVLRSQRY